MRIEQLLGAQNNVQFHSNPIFPPSLACSHAKIHCSVCYEGEQTWGKRKYVPLRKPLNCQCIFLVLHQLFGWLKSDKGACQLTPEGIPSDTSCPHWVPPLPVSNMMQVLFHLDPPIPSWSQPYFFLSLLPIGSFLPYMAVAWKHTAMRASGQPFVTAINCQGPYSPVVDCKPIFHTIFYHFCINV